MKQWRSRAAGLAGLVLGTSVLALVGTPTSYADFASDCGSPDRTISGDRNGSLAVPAGQTVLLTSGSFKGGIDSFPAGATLCVSSSAVVEPNYVNNAAGALVIAAGGEVRLKSVAFATGFSLDNAGVFRASSLNINGAATLYNARGGELRFDGGFTPAAGAITNDGLMVIKGGGGLNTAVTLENNRAVNISGGFNVDGVLHNTGAVRVSGKLTVNGSGRYVNDCAVSVGGDLANNGQQSSNTGVTVVGQAFSNNGTWTQTPTGVTGAATLGNDGNVTGFGRYRFTGATKTQGMFSGTSASSPILVDDRTPPTPPQIFDTQSGTVTNTVTGTVAAPAPGERALPGCSIDAPRTPTSRPPSPLRRRSSPVPRSSSRSRSPTTAGPLPPAWSSRTTCPTTWSVR